MDGEDSRVGEPRSELDFPLEPLGAEHGGELGSQHLDRDRPTVPEIVREVHGGHATVAELPLDAVAIGEGGGEAVLDGGTGGIHALSLSRETAEG